MEERELNEILRRHKAWLNGEEGGKRADLQRADLHGESLESVDLAGADLQHSDLRNAILRGTNLKSASLDHADLQHSDLRFAVLHHADLNCANLHRANLYRADMRGTNIDYASWPMRCGSLQAYIDDRIAIQLLYHTLSVVQHSPYVSEEVKKALLSAENVKIANRFHRVWECGKIEEWEEEK